MLLPSQIRLLATIVIILAIGWAVKQYRDHASLEPVKAKA